MQIQRSFSYLRMKEKIDAFIREFETSAPTIEVQTSGSTGVPKRISVEKERMKQSAQRTLDALGLRSGATAIICLPIEYIAGKMMVVRALVGAMRVIAVTPTSNPLLPLNTAELDKQCLLAITPYQLAEILNNPSSLETLKRVSHVIIGGGAIPADVEELVSHFPDSTAIYATYGMTETLSHIALRRVNGTEREETFLPLPGVTIQQDEEGCLKIKDIVTSPEILQTNDIVELINGRFRILGRRDNIISSGGIKLQLEMIEQQLSEVISDEFMLTYVRDSRFGQALTMLYTGELSEEEVHQRCADRVGNYEVPKYFFRTKELPKTETGKLARAQAHDLAETLKMGAE